LDTFLPALREAAERGDIGAQVTLGSMYFNGEDVLKDYVEATKWYRKAADQGDFLAQLKLGAMYSVGSGGVPQDYVMAYMWTNLAYAALSGNLQKEAAELRAEIAAKMTSQQIAQAQQLAREWKPVVPK
jgi:TPR repeat protein